MKLQAFLSQNSSACDLKCIHISKTMIKIIKQLRKSKKIVIKKNFKHDNYKDVLLNNKQIYHIMKTIRRDVYKTWTPGPWTTPVDHPSFCKITSTKNLQTKEGGKVR